MWLRSVGVGAVEIDFSYATTGVYAKFFNGRKTRLVCRGGLETSQIRTVPFFSINISSFSYKTQGKSAHFRQSVQSLNSTLNLCRSGGQRSVIEKKHVSRSYGGTGNRSE